MRCDQTLSLGVEASATNMSDSNTPTFVVRLEEWFRRDVEARAVEVAGGPARLRVIVLLASVLGLDCAVPGAGRCINAVSVMGTDEF